jgi:hypothetical protein
MEAAIKLAERGVDDMEDAADKAEDAIEDQNDTDLVDWIRALGATLVGALLIAFAWRGPPLAWADIGNALGGSGSDGDDGGDDTPAWTPPPTPPPAPEPESLDDDDDLDLEIEDPDPPDTMGG